MNYDSEHLQRIRQIAEEWSDPFKDFLASHVNSVDGCERLLFALREIQADGTQVRTETGNAYSVLITADGVNVQNIWDEEMPALEYSLEEFERLLLPRLEQVKSKERGY